MWRGGERRGCLGAARCREHKVFVPVQPCNQLFILEAGISSLFLGGFEPHSARIGRPTIIGCGRCTGGEV